MDLRHIVNRPLTQYNVRACVASPFVVHVHNNNNYYYYYRRDATHYVTLTNPRTPLTYIKLAYRDPTYISYSDEKSEPAAFDEYTETERNQKCVDMLGMLVLPLQPSH